MSLPVTMRAAFLERPGVISMRSVPVPVPGPGELLVRVEAALTCGTDLKTFRRGHAKLPLPAPFGHELSGTVAAAGAGVTAFAEGDALMLVPTAPCGECTLCHAGRENLCASAVGRMVLGAFADFVLLPAHIVRHHVFRRPQSLGAAAAAALEPLACVVHGASRIRWDDAPDVLILGDGAIALLFARVAALRGAARVRLLGRHEQRLSVARQYGAHTIGADSDAAAHAAVVRDRPHVVIECVGTPDTWRLASGLAAAGGRVLLFGGCAAGTDVGFDAYRMHYEEVDHSGAFHYTPRAVATARELLVSGEVDVTPLITTRLPLAALESAIAMIAERRAIKVEIVP